MQRFITVFVWMTLILGAGSPSLIAQDLSKEIRDSWGDQTSAIAKLKLEQDILSRVESRLSDRYERLLFESAEIEKKLAASESAPQTLSTLLQNCLVELQRIRWEEATEQAVIEELETTSVKSPPTESDLASLALKVRMDTLSEEVVRQKEKNARLQQFFARGELSTGDLADNEGKLKVMLVELEGVRREFEAQQAIAESEKKLPMLETTRRLAKYVARRRLLEKEADQIREENRAVVEIRQKQLQATLIQKRIELLQQQLIPIQSRKLQVESMIEAYEQPK